MCKKEPIICNVGQSSILLLHVLGHTVINSSPSVCKAFLISERRFSLGVIHAGCFHCPRLVPYKRKPHVWRFMCKSNLDGIDNIGFTFRKQQRSPFFVHLKGEGFTMPAGARKHQVKFYLPLIQQHIKLWHHRILGMLYGHYTKFFHSISYFRLCIYPECFVMLLCQSFM